MKIMVVKDIERDDIEFICKVKWVTEVAVKVAAMFKVYPKTKYPASASLLWHFHKFYVLTVM